MSTAPPHSISLAKPIGPGASGRRVVESTEPSDQQAVATNAHTTLAGAAEKLSPRISSATPSAPIHTPASSHAPGRRPQNSPQPVTISGTEATHVAISPEPTWRLAVAMRPIPAPSIRPPTMNALRH